MLMTKIAVIITHYAENVSWPTHTLVVLFFFSKPRIIFIFETKWSISQFFSWKIVEDSISQNLDTQADTRQVADTEQECLQK